MWNTPIASVLSQYFKITDATITQENNKYYVQLGEENVQLYGQGDAKNFTLSNLSPKYTIVGFPTLYNTTLELQIFEEPQIQTYNITAATNNAGWGTVVYENGVITATPAAGYRLANQAYSVTSGTATVTQEGNEFVVDAETDCTVTINFEKIPEHNVVWSINGEETTTTALEDAAVEFPTAPEAIEGKTFVGWVAEAIDGETNEAPTFVTSATMATSDLKYYAVFASQEGFGDPTWTETALSALTASDIFVIVGNGYAMPHNNGTSSAPTATAVTVDDSNLTSTVTDNIKWNVSGNATEGYTFYPNGDDKKWLYCNTTAASSSNNNMRVGTGDRKVFELDTNGYLVTKDTYTTRYLSLYNDQDFRGYVTTSNGAFVPAFYKYSSNISYSGYCTTVIKPVAQIGDVKYATLAEAVAAVPTDGTETTITMIEDEAVVAGITVAAGQNVVLELNGKTVSGNTDSSKTYALITNKGTLTIQDNTDTNKDGTGTGLITTYIANPDGGDVPGYASNTITNNGDLTVKSGKIVNNGNGYACYAIDNQTNGTAYTPTLKIEGGRMQQMNAYTYAVRMFCNSTTNLNSVEVSGGVIEGGYGLWLQTPNDKANMASLTITGGVLNARDGAALYVGGTKADNSKISINIDGGQVNGTGVIIQGPLSGTYGEVSITDGEFAKVQCGANVEKFITGGTFGEEPAAAYLADAYMAKKVGEVYEVVPAVAKVGDVKYETFAEAIAALTEEINTITLLADIAEAYTLAEAQSLNVNLNGHKLNVVAPAGNILKTSEADGVTTYSYVAPVAKIGDALYETLQAAVDAATEEDNVVTLLSDIDLASEYVNINKAVTIKGEGYTITSTAAQAILLTGEGDFTLENTNVVASKGHGIQAGNDNTAYAGTLAMEGSTLTVAKRGIRVYKEDTGFGIDINNSTIQSTKEDPTTTYTTGNDAMALSLGATDGKGYEVNVTNSTLQGFSYLLNVVTSGSNLTVNMTGGKGYGRAIVNTWGSNNTITLDGVEVHGLNNQTGPTEAFACVVDNEGAQNNTFVLKDCQFTGTLSEAALTTEGSTASEHLLQLNGMNAIVKVLGSTTYSCNSDDKSRGGIFYTESYLNNNKLYFDDTTKQTFANAFELSVIADEKEAEVDLYPVSFEPEVLYYWATESGYQGGYYNFAEPFVEGWLADGEFIALQKDITLTEDITCQLASGTSFNFLLGDFTADKNGHSVALNTGVTVLTDKQTDIFKAAEAGYVIVETKTETGYSYTAEKVMLAQPIIFHDGGEYEGKLTVAIAGEGVKYTLNGAAEQTYSAPFTISDEGEYTIKAWVEQEDIKSSEVTKTFTIVAKQAGAEVPDGYYNIMTNDGKYVNVAGRKTVTLVEAKDAEGKAGTVIRVNADAKGVKVLRSQGVDLPGYAKKAMNYVPEIVQLAVDKLHAEGAGELLGETGLEKIMDKFNESFDYNLYLEKDGEAYRIYGRTPSMKPVVDFYAENKANVDAKLPELEEFINKAIQKVLQKTNGSGASVLVPFSLQTIWERMGSTLTNPADDEAKFYEEVLSSEANVWNFAYQTAMLYWGNLKNHPRFAEIQDKLGDYSKYIDKVENIRPNFRYYIVPSASGVDFISQGNSMITDASTAWTMESVSEFMVNFETEQAFNIYPTTSGGKTIEAKEYYTTLYTDFAYTLPEGVKAYKVTEITEKYGVAKREEITGVIPAQTPVLLVKSNEGAQTTLTLTTEAGTAVTGNLLVGADALINEYQIKTPQVVSLFDMAKSILGESAYETYLKKYEHLMLKNAGTVGNKYFFGLTADDLKGVTDLRVLTLDNAGMNPGFHDIWEKVDANKAVILTNDYNPVKLFLVGDVNRDGNISIADVTALVNIILGKATYPEDNDKYDFAAANVNNDKAITISDVTALVNIILGK